MSGDVTGRCAIEPQQHSKNSHKSAAPVWNQGFVFADAYASAKVSVTVFLHTTPPAS